MSSWTDGAISIIRCAERAVLVVVVVLVSLPVEAIQSFSCFLRSLPFQSLVFPSKVLYPAEDGSLFTLVL